MLVPVIGLIQVGNQAWADRYASLSLVGVYLMFAWTLARLVHRHPALRPAVICAVAALLAGFLLLTWRQVGVWRNNQTLNEHALAVIRNNYVAHNNWGNGLTAVSRHQEAIAQYQEALRIKPDYPEAHSGLGISLKVRGRFKEALSHFNEAVQHRPLQVSAVNNLAWLLATCPLAELRDGERALKLAGTLVSLQGSDRFAYLDTVAAAYAEARQFAQAVKWQEKAVQLAPVPHQEELNKRLELYRQGKPFCQNPPIPVDK